MGCGQQNDTPLLPETQDSNLKSSNNLWGSVGVTTSTVLNGYLLEFTGRTVANNQTTFSYTVSGTGGQHSLSHFALELPVCAPALDAFAPSGSSIGVNPLTGLFSIKWDISLGQTESRDYSITFPGDVPLGVIVGAVKAGNDLGTGEIAGPCAGFVIAGSVYVDADSNGVRDPLTESGIENVTVTLEDGNGNRQTSTSDVDGGYTFLKLSGTYTVRVEATTPENDFNEELASSFDPTGPTSLTVTVGPDAPGNDFGFDPKAEEIILDLEAGVLQTDGQDVRFWTKQVRSALHGGKGNPAFPLDDMEDFIAAIQELYLPDPFQFTPGNEFQEALDILNDKTKDDLVELRKQLLAAEFNEVSGKGLIGASALQSVILSWAEALVAEGLANPTPVSKQGLNRAGDLTGNVHDATRLLILLNGSTGGGGGGEG
jgi:hypothetical protein